MKKIDFRNTTWYNDIACYLSEEKVKYEWRVIKFIADKKNYFISILEDNFYLKNDFASRDWQGDVRIYQDDLDVTHKFFNLLTTQEAPIELDINVWRRLSKITAGIKTEEFNFNNIRHAKVIEFPKADKENQIGMNQTFKKQKVAS